MPPTSAHDRYRFSMPSSSDRLDQVGSAGAGGSTDPQWAPDDADWLGGDTSDSFEFSDPRMATPTDPVVVSEAVSARTSPANTVNRSTTRAAKKRVKAVKKARRQALERRRKRMAPRRRILPRTAIGICLLLLTTALAVGSISAVLYMNYAYKKDRSEALVQGLDRRIREGSQKISNEATNAQARIQDELAPLSKLAATGDTLSTLLETGRNSLWVVRTFDEAGAPAVGTAFVVAADAQRSFLLTSYDVVKAATRDPGPAVTLRQGTTDLPASLWTWDETNDVALLIVDQPSLPKLPWGRPNEVRLGTQIFAMSALGTAGGAVTQGFVADVSSTGIQHTAPLGVAFRGAPLVDNNGRVVGVATRTFAPLGFASDGVWFAPPIGAACQKVLRCEADVVRGAGAKR